LWNIDYTPHVKDVHVITLTDGRKLLTIDGDAFVGLVPPVGSFNQRTWLPLIERRIGGDHESIMAGTFTVALVVIVLGDREKIETNVAGLLERFIRLAAAVAV
jgi:hypothetical protein